MTPDNVVQKGGPLTEERFHAIFLQSLSRMVAAHGDGQVALWLGLSTRQLRNIKAGALPTADKIWNLLVHDDSAHDEIDRHYGARKVPASAICSTDPISSRVSALLTRAIEAERPDSPGGETVVLAEILKMDEAILRAVHRRIGGWIDQLDEYRKPSIFARVA